MNKNNLSREIIDSLMVLPKPTRRDLHRLKLNIASKYNFSDIISNADIISALKPEEKSLLLPLLRRKSTRSISGVTVIAVMTTPHPCPQTDPCSYCPGGPKLGAPQSYTGYEPAAMRGAQNNYDPYLQVQSRINQLTCIGHKVDKIELIIMGGTFPSTPIEYQRWFIQRSLDAITNKESISLNQAKLNAETSKKRNVGITVETRPDWAKKEHVDLMLDLGVTRIEIGVQNPKDEIYRLVGRKHTVADVEEATRIAKDAGLKIVYHMMPGMPGSNPSLDFEAFKQVFSYSIFKPDMIKIYPCLVINSTEVFNWYKKGIYKPYTTQEASDLIADVKKIVPPWIRIMRVQRDIPAHLIVAGVNKSNLRQIIHQKLSDQDKKCRCIRCREVGHKNLVGIAPNLDNISLLSTTYEASGGKEIFLSIEDLSTDILIGYLRLRIPSEKAHRSEIIKLPSAIVRELHIYGQLVPVGNFVHNAWQHKGYGSILLNEAERVAKEDYDLKKLLIISALGTKEYYKRFGYEADGVYVSKILERK